MIIFKICMFISVMILLNYGTVKTNIYRLCRKAKYLANWKWHESTIYQIYISELNIVQKLLSDISCTFNMYYVL